MKIERFGETQSIYGKISIDKEKKQEVKAVNKKTKIFSSRKSVNAFSYMTRLANAKTESAVSSVIRSAGYEVRFLKSLGATEKEIAAARRMVNKITERGNIKISNLKKERELERNRQLAETTDNLEREKLLSKEISGRKRTRKSKERIDVVSSGFEYIKNNSNDSVYNKIGNADMTAGNLSGIDIFL